MKKETAKKTKAKQTEETVSKVEPKAEVAEEIKPTPTEAELFAEEAKKLYKEVFITTVADQQIVWRKLKRSEYKEAMLKINDDNEDITYYERQDFMAKKVILFPKNVDELLEEYAGIADVIATETMVKTGFGLTRTKSV